LLNELLNYSSWLFISYVFLRDIFFYDLKLKNLFILLPKSDWVTDLRSLLEKNFSLTEFNYKFLYDLYRSPPTSLFYLFLVYYLSLNKGLSL
jgi:hypothetical protein